MPARFSRASTATGDSQRRAPSTIRRAPKSNACLNPLASDCSTNSGANGAKWLWRTTGLRRDVAFARNTTTLHGLAAR